VGTMGPIGAGFPQLGSRLLAMISSSPARSETLSQVQPHRASLADMHGQRLPGEDHGADDPHPASLPAEWAHTGTAVSQAGTPR